MNKQIINVQPLSVSWQHHDVQRTWRN